MCVFIFSSRISTTEYQLAVQPIILSSVLTSVTRGKEVLVLPAAQVLATFWNNQMISYSRSISNHHSLVSKDSRFYRSLAIYTPLMSIIWHSLSNLFEISYLLLHFGTRCFKTIQIFRPDRLMCPRKRGLSFYLGSLSARLRCEIYHSLSCVY